MIYEEYLEIELGSSKVSTDLGHHSSPCNDISIYLLTRLLLMSNDSFEKAIEVVISSVV
jgi:hypothetical protein